MMLGSVTAKLYAGVGNIMGVICPRRWVGFDQNMGLILPNNLVMMPRGPFVTPATRILAKKVCAFHMLSVSCWSMIFLNCMLFYALPDPDPSLA